MSLINNLHYRRHLLPGLEKYVKYLWVMRCQERVSAPDLLIPDGYPEVIFVLNGAYRKQSWRPEVSPCIITRSCVVGIQTHTVVARRLDACYLVGLKLMPAGAYALFGDRMQTTGDKNVWLSDFGVDWLSDLESRLHDCTEGQLLVDAVQRTVRHQVERLPHEVEDDGICDLLTAVLLAKGQLSVADLAAQQHMSVRQLQRRFKRYFGVSPKKFINLIRFKTLYKSSILQNRPPADYLAYGYYDQMHFIHDFQKHLGVNPTQHADCTFVQKNRMARMNT